MPPAIMHRTTKRVKQACDRCRVKKTKVSAVSPDAIKRNSDLGVV
jgi:hypothetical protein